MILAIDPGTTQSAYAIIAIRDAFPVEFEKCSNEKLETWIDKLYYPLKAVVIEMVTSYGKPVGQETFETCRWIGRFEGAARNHGIPCELISRKDVKTHICGTLHANDATVRRRLIERFAKIDKTNGKGRMDNPDWFYGFKADVWQSYALGIAWLDRQKEEKQ